MDILLANPRGFCAGVNRAIAIVRQALERYSPPIYVLHEIVHNTHVLYELRNMGAVFVEELAEIPPGAITIFSAHGVARAVEQEAAARGLRTIDATCPLVSKIHYRMRRLSEQGYTIMVIGHKRHPEVEGTCGQAEGPVHVLSEAAEVAALPLLEGSKVGYVTQTTLSVNETEEILAVLRQKFPHISGPDHTDICYATTNRQAAVRRLAERVDLVLIVGSKNSSNSNRLREVAELLQTPAYLIDDAGDLYEKWFAGVRTLGVSAGASAPEHLVTEVVDWLRGRYPVERVEEINGESEGINFHVPQIKV